MTKKVKLSPECRSKKTHRFIIFLKRGKMIVGKCVSLYKALSAVDDIGKRRTGKINLFGNIVDIADIVEIRFDDKIIYRP